MNPSTERSTTTRPPAAAPPADAPLLRDLDRRADRAALERILRATRAFTDAEVDVALELVDEPAATGYRFVVAETDGAIAGYACFGATPCTVGTWDLYWIAVDPARQGSGVGRALLDAVERAVRAESGRLLVIETASKPEYEATRRFYERCGLELAARIRDFYARGDDKLVYCRRYDP
jgi:ribosomal protein S18 acetylase RimI-like enzyme